MALSILGFQQLTGINIIMFYAPVLFKTISFGDNASLMSAVITGLVNVRATIVSIVTIDRLGRKFLFVCRGRRVDADRRGNPSSSASTSSDVYYCPVLCDGTLPPQVRPLLAFCFLRGGDDALRHLVTTGDEECAD